jgi:hypothetical protein
MVKLLHYIDPNIAPAPPSASGSAEETIRKAQVNDLVKGTCKSLSPFVADDFVEDVLLDTANMGDSKADSNRFKATYPPSDMSTSSSTILKPPTLDVNCRTVRSKNSPESFLKIVVNAYSGTQREAGANTKLLCNLISQQADTDNMIVNTFEFDSEVEYWTFVGEIKRSITCIHTNTKHEAGAQAGHCHYLPSMSQTALEASATPGAPNGSTKPAPASSKSAAASSKSSHRGSTGQGILGSLLFGGQKDSVPRNHRWEITGPSLVVVDTHSQYRGTFEAPVHICCCGSFPTFSWTVVRSHRRFPLLSFE